MLKECTRLTAARGVQAVTRCPRAPRGVRHRSVASIHCWVGVAACGAPSSSQARRVCARARQPRRLAPVCGERNVPAGPVRVAAVTGVEVRFSQTRCYA